MEGEEKRKEEKGVGKDTIGRDRLKGLYAKVEERKAGRIGKKKDENMTKE